MEQTCWETLWQFLCFLRYSDYDADIFLDTHLKEIKPLPYKHVYTNVLALLFTTA